MAEDVTPVRCVRCGQPLQRPVAGPWKLEGFYSEWVNPRGFPWCPGGSDLVPHLPDSDSPG